MRPIASILKHFFSKVTQDVSRAPGIPLDFASYVVFPFSIVRRNGKDPALKENVLNDLLQLLFVFSERQESTMVLRQDYSLAVESRPFICSLLGDSEIPAKWQ
jgi:hypothetical protein